MANAKGNPRPDHRRAPPKSDGSAVIRTACPSPRGHLGSKCPWCDHVDGVATGFRTYSRHEWEERRREQQAAHREKSKTSNTTSLGVYDGE